MTVPTLRKCTAIAFLLLLVNAAYIWAFAFPTIFYMTNVLVHLGLGVTLSLVLAWLVGRDAQLRNGILLAVGFFLAAFLLGAYLAGAGNTLDHRWALLAHIAAAQPTPISIAMEISTSSSPLTTALPTCTATISPTAITS